MDSKTVSRALREEVRPILKDAGFTRFTSRKAWRVDPDTVQVIDFQSLNSYLAEAIGTTTYSFGGHLGVYYVALRHVPWGERRETPPEEFHCQARRVLRKALEQPELPRADLWYVSPDGRNLPSVIADVSRAITEEAMPWFAYFSDVKNALEAFDARDEDFDAGIAVELLSGRPNSAARAQITSALALALGEPRRAVAAWQRHLEEPFYQRLPDYLESAVRNITWIEEHGGGLVRNGMAGV
jgi:hypothetical protein